MKVRIDIGDKGLTNSKLYVEGREIYFQKLELIIDSPGKTRLRVKVPNRQEAGKVPLIEGELQGHIEPGDVEIEIAE